MNSNDFFKGVIAATQKAQTVDWSSVDPSEIEQYVIECENIQLQMTLLSSLNAVKTSLLRILFAILTLLCVCLPLGVDGQHIVFYSCIICALYAGWIFFLLHTCLKQASDTLSKFTQFVDSKSSTGKIE